MTSPRPFISRPTRVEVMGPLTEDNADEVTRWCGGVVLNGRHLRNYMGHYIIRHPDGSIEALTRDELVAKWQDESGSGSRRASPVG